MKKHKILASASIAAIAAMLSVSLAGKAFALDECGATVAGADTVTCDTSATYAGGIAYLGTDGMTLNLNNSGIVVGPVTNPGVRVTGGVGITNDLIINATSFDSISTTGTILDSFRHGIMISHGGPAGTGIITMSSGSVSTAVPSSFGLYSDVFNPAATGAARVNMSGGTVSTTGNQSFGLYSVNRGQGNAEITFSGTAAVVANAAGSHALHTSVTNGPGTSSITISGGEITAAVGYGAHAIQTGLGTGNATITMTGGSVQRGTNNVNPSSALSSEIINLTSPGEASVTVSGGTVSTQSAFAQGMTARTTGLGAVSTRVSGSTAIINTAGTSANGLFSEIANVNSTAAARAAIENGTINIQGAFSAGLHAINRGGGDAITLMTGGDINVAGTETIGSYGLLSLAGTNANSTGTARTTMEGGTISMTLTGGLPHLIAGYGALISRHAGLGNAETILKDGDIETSWDNSYGLLSDITLASSAATASTTMEDGEVLTEGVRSHGIYSRTIGTGIAEVEMTDGTVTVSGDNADGVLAQSAGGTYDVDITGGTIIGGAGRGAAVRTRAAGGGTIDIGADATINAGTSGIAIRDGDNDYNGVDETGGNVAVSIAGEVTGDVILGLGNDTLLLTGQLDGTFYGDDVAASGGDGNDTFTVDGGIWNAANFYGGNGDDTLTLQNGALADMDLSATIDAENVNIDATSTLRGAGGGSGVFDLSGAHVFNTGLVSLGDGMAGDYLLAGSWQAGSGTIELDVASPTETDRLLIPGDMTGTTTIRVISAGSTGPFTGTSNIDGISIVQVGGLSTADAFSLENGYAAVGPYRYTLVAFDPLSSDPGELDAAMPAGDFWDYRLQWAGETVSQIDAYRSFTLGSAAFSWALLESLHKRSGEIRHGDLNEIAPAAGEDSSADSANRFGIGDGPGEVYIRARGVLSETEGDKGAGMEQKVWFVQGGYDITMEEMRGGTLRFGPALSFGGSHLQVDNGAEVDLTSPSLAMTATYETGNGIYVDGIVQGTMHSADISTPEGGKIADADGWGAAVSVETGMPLAAGAFTIEPQAQLTYQWVDFEDFTDNDGVEVGIGSEDSLRGRLGVMVEKTMTTNSGAQWAPHMTFDIIHEFLEGDGITAGGVAFDNDLGGTSTEIGAGIHARASGNTEIYFDISYGHALTDSAADSLAGTARVKFRW